MKNKYQNKIKNWKDLLEILSNMNEKELKQKAIIFPFANGEMEEIKSLNSVGEQEDIDSHASNCPKKGYYLFSGY